MNEIGPVLAGLRWRCPRCGTGSLFSSYLKIADQCPECGLDHSRADAGDGPAVFIMFAVGFIIVPLALIVEITLTPPIWLHMAMWIPAALALITVMLPSFKGVLYALQWYHNAHEARLDEEP